MFNWKVKKYVQNNGGMIKIHQELVDHFVNKGFEIRTVKKDLIYLHYGTDIGKGGIYVRQTEINETTISFGIETHQGFHDEYELKFNTDQGPDSVLSEIEMPFYTFGILVRENADKNRPHNASSDQMELDDESYSSHEIYMLKSEARSLFKQGDYNLAAKLYYEVVESEPTEVFPVIQLANCFLAKGEHERALLFTEIAKDRDKTDFRIYSFRATVELDRGFIEQAFEEIIKAKNYSDGSIDEINKLYDSCLENLLKEVYPGSCIITRILPVKNENKVYIKFSEYIGSSLKNQKLPAYLPKLYKFYLITDVNKLGLFPDLKFKSKQVLEDRKPIDVKMVNPQISNKEFHINLSDSLSPPNTNVADNKSYAIKDPNSGEFYTKDGYIIFQKLNVVKGTPNHKFIYPNGKVADYKRGKILTE